MILSCRKTGREKARERAPAEAGVATTELSDDEGRDVALDWPRLTQPSLKAAGHDNAGHAIWP
jgi:hypothetical protein